jgi:hypothetical protein
MTEAERQPARTMTMTPVATQQSTQNMEYVLGLLQHKQPGFSASRELALVLAERELWPPQLAGETGATRAHGR